ncbi:MAG: TIGR03118 family protein [Candidatus Competibacteraceae bacterium]
MTTIYRFFCKRPLIAVGTLVLMLSSFFLLSCGGGGGGGNGDGGGTSTESTSYRQTNLVSDGAVSAAYTDRNLVNPWGISFSPTGPFWVSDNGTGISTLYNGAGQPFPLSPASPLVVTIPLPTGSPTGTRATPTGQVFNGTSGFVIRDPATGNSGPSRFIFATEDGTLSGFNSDVNPTSAILTFSNPNAVYKGLAISSNGSRLYAANFKVGAIEMFDSDFDPITSFTDPNIPSGFAPFNVQDINGKLYVTYAKQQQPDNHDDEAGPGNGFVDVFDEDGNLLQRLVSQGNLNSPWGLALAPGNFGRFSNALLVGNFGDGRIDAFDREHSHFVGFFMLGYGS